MDFGSIPNFANAETWAILGKIMLINIVLSGDNAIVIAMAARNLPAQHQKKAILWGTVGAIAVRVVMTLAVVWLLMIPGLKLVGGLLLIWIGYKLLVEEEGDEDHGEGASNFWGAMKTIMIADAAMGVDNVLGVAAAAGNNFPLIVIGLLISIPIVVFGSTLVMKIMEKFPIVVWIGSGLLALAAAEIIWDEKLFEAFTKANGVLQWPFIIAVIAAVIMAAKWKLGKRAQTGEATPA